jgi:hypothetical protein
MSDSMNGLQFETAEGLAPGSVSCSVCSTGLVSEYHELNGQAVCAACRARAEAEYARDRQWSQWIVAAVYGFGAALLGGFLYWGFVKITNIELGLMAIAVGWLVGKAIMKGSNHRGGRRYQFLALALTYFSITISYGALIVGEILSKAPEVPAQTQQQQINPGSAPSASSSSTPPAPAASAPSAEAPKEKVPESTTESTKQEPMTAGGAVLGFGFLFLIMLASPFLAGFSNFLGWIIIAIGLFEAWKHTREVPFLTGGPYQIAVPAAATPPPVPAEADAETREESEESPSA